MGARSAGCQGMDAGAEEAEELLGALDLDRDRRAEADARPARDRGAGPACLGAPRSTCRPRRSRASARRPATGAFPRSAPERAVLAPRTPNASWSTAARISVPRPSALPRAAEPRAGADGQCLAEPFGLQRLRADRRGRRRTRRGSASSGHIPARIPPQWFGALCGCSGACTRSRARVDQEGDRERQHDQQFEAAEHRRGLHRQADAVAGEPPDHGDRRQPDGPPRDVDARIRCAVSST